MSSAAERAKARREALLNRGTDRLAKLTTSARGGEDTTYLRHDRPLAPSLTNFLGEDSGASTPVPPSTPQRRPSRAESASPAHLHAPPATGAGFSRSASMPPTSSLAALAASAPPPQFEDFASGLPPGMQLPPLFEQLLAGAAGGGAGGGGLGDNPLAALFPQGMPQGMPQMPQETQLPQQQRTRTFSQRLFGLLRPLGILVLVMLAVYWQRLHSGSWEQRARAWGDLNQRRDNREVAMLPAAFFWTFLALLIGQHAFRILDDNNPVSLPTLVSFALPHLPPPLPSLIVNGARYYNLFSIVLDDIAVLVFALGVVIWINGL